ncbi:hypothetical protein E2C01_005964 [Portunus trituberculatus]|uniref:Uncharacterized protein n=1 Tax=Portunus trituberculatus TaxID=210409 RepID=A0A5B7CVN0_PORTR|nr:hypothetical protein [Portunus trituberculatus]
MMNIARAEKRHKEGRTSWTGAAAFTWQGAAATGTPEKRIRKTEGAACLQFLVRTRPALMEDQDSTSLPGGGHAAGGFLKVIGRAAAAGIMTSRGNRLRPIAGQQESLNYLPPLSNEKEQREADRYAVQDLAEMGLGGGRGAELPLSPTSTLKNSNPFPIRRQTSSYYSFSLF